MGEVPVARTTKREPSVVPQGLREGTNRGCMRQVGWTLKLGEQADMHRLTQRQLMDQVAAFQRDFELRAGLEQQLAL